MAANFSFRNNFCIKTVDVIFYLC